MPQYCEFIKNKYQDLGNDKELNLRNCVLLDNESTVNALWNPNLVQKIFDTNDEEMTLVSNGGSLTTNKQCVVKNLNQPVWFHKDYITNFLSLGILKKLYIITYGSKRING